MKTKNHQITTVLSSPLPVSYILATEMFCAMCGTRTNSSIEAQHLLQHGGLCKACLEELRHDHVYGEYLDNMKYEASLNNLEEEVC